ncbi:hypothetical protein [Arthrobacter sp. PAMC 25486]|uniref:hypothetical protein n=1 Tax=Arthrobacter sp. PAMC 25486 TaxID=1494608 RepID=UPI00056DE7D6|nr:hypothetical protein [Arthrobacter sp. PAMC 25486]
MNTQELPASAYRITSHEILALLSFNSGKEIDLSRSVLNLADLPDDSDLVRAGISTLNVRGSVRRDGEEIALQGDAEIIARILASGHTWYQIARVGQDQSALPTYVVESVGAKAAFLLQPLSEYICVPLREDTEILDFVGQVVDGTVADAQKVGAGLVVSQKWVLDAEPVVANIKVEQGKPTLLAALPVTDDGQLSVRELQGPAGAVVVAALRGQS